METCVICKKTSIDRDTVILREKGANGINAAGEKRGLTLQVTAGQTVHQQCRRDYCKTQNIKRCSDSLIDQEHKLLRSSGSNFNFKEDCLFCGQPAKYDGKKKGFEVFPVRTKDFQLAIEQQCQERNDDWSQKVIGRLNFAQDLHAADAVYHQTCSVNFRTNKSLPLEYSLHKNVKRKRTGRPEQSNRSKAFLEVIEYLKENDDEQITIGDLVIKMKEFLCDANDQPYSAVYMRGKLVEHFGDSIIIARLNGKQNVVTFRSTAKTILQEFYANPQNADSESEKMKIIETASKLIKNDIRTLEASNDEYPLNIIATDEAVAYLPLSLQQFLKLLFPGKHNIKVASIGQAIMQATRPRVLLAPLQIGLGIQMHHHFGSRFLIDSLHAHGFCCPYSEVKKFERSAAVSQGTDLPVETSTHFVQHIADNVDHNIRTLDGHGTFHGMGIIATITPEIKQDGTIP